MLWPHLMAFCRKLLLIVISGAMTSATVRVPAYAALIVGRGTVRVVTVVTFGHRVAPQLGD